MRESHAVRRVEAWIEVDPPREGWWPGALLPLLLLLLLLLVAWLYVAPRMVERESAAAASARLAQAGFSGLDVQADGQWLTVSGMVDDDRSEEQVIAFAESARCSTWAGSLVCPTRVAANLIRPAPAPKVEASPPPPKTAPPPPPAVAPIADEVIDRCEAEFKAVLETSKIYFATGKAEIRPRSRAALQALATTAERCPGQLYVDGHTDDVGRPELNQELSEARAQAVVSALSTMGVDADRMSARGFGADRPTADNKTKAGRAANRRIEVHLRRHQENQR